MNVVSAQIEILAVKAETGLLVPKDLPAFPATGITQYFLCCHQHLENTKLAGSLCCVRVHYFFSLTYKRSKENVQTQSAVKNEYQLQLFDYY